MFQSVTIRYCRLETVSLPYSQYSVCRSAACHYGECSVLCIQPNLQVVVQESPEKISLLIPSSIPGKNLKKNIQCQRVFGRNNIACLLDLDSYRFSGISYPSNCLCLRVCRSSDEINVIMLPTSVDVHSLKCLHNDKYIRYCLRRGKLYKSFNIQTYELYSTFNTEKDISSFEISERSFCFLQKENLLK